LRDGPAVCFDLFVSQLARALQQSGNDLRGNSGVVQCDDFIGAGMERDWIIFSEGLDDG
jgi:hypothetical protein